MHVGLVDRLWEGHHTPYIVYLTQYLIDQGHRVTFVTDARHPRLSSLPDTPAFQISALNLPTTEVDPGAGFAMSLWEQIGRTRQLRRITKTLAAADVDLAHLLYFDRTQIPFWWSTHVGNPWPAPVLATQHRDAFTDSEAGGIGKRLTQAATRYALNGALRDGTLSILTVHAHSIRNRIIETVPAATIENTRVIPAPTPSLSIDVAPAAARESLNLPPSAPIALFFGGLRHEKGPDLLAEAVTDFDQPLIIVYAGSAQDYTQADVVDWQEAVDSNVRIVDRVEYIPERELDLYFLAADVLVLPYRRSRGISGPLRRACAAGTPIIGNRESDVGLIIEEHNLGWTFTTDSESSLQQTLRRFLSEYQAFPRDGLHRYAETHHWTETGRMLEELYSEVSRGESD